MEIQFKNTTRLRDTKNVIITPARGEQISCASSQKRLQILSFPVVVFQRIIIYSFRLFFILLENPRSTATAQRHCSHLRQRPMSTPKYLHMTSFCSNVNRIRFTKVINNQQIKKHTKNTISRKD